MWINYPTPPLGQPSEHGERLLAANNMTKEGRRKRITENKSPLTPQGATYRHPEVLIYSPRQSGKGQAAMNIREQVSPEQG